MSTGHGRVDAPQGGDAGARLPGDRTAPFLVESDRAAALSVDNVRGGRGTIRITPFRFGETADPAAFLMYETPCGASEGVHTHRLDDPVLGAFDEYYYVVSGEGRMRIGDELVPVVAGDHVFAPVGVPHGIENTASAPLKVLLTYIRR